MSASQYDTSPEHKHNLLLVLCNDTHKVHDYIDNDSFTINKASITRTYKCDLLKLMELSIQVHEYDIALNIGKINILKEIIVHVSFLLRQDLN